MAGRNREDPIGLAPGPEPAPTGHETDFYSWALEQARLVREGRFDALDRANLAEEIEALGREQFNKLESALRVLLMHMLKWDHQPALRSRSWALTMAVQRLEVEDVLDDNPGLTPRIPEALARAYRKARIEAARETGLEETEFPPSCPFDWDRILRGQ